MRYPNGGPRSNRVTAKRMTGASDGAGSGRTETNPGAGTSKPMTGGTSIVAMKWQTAHCGSNGLFGCESCGVVFPGGQHDRPDATPAHEPPSLITPRGCSGTTTPNQTAIVA